MNKIEIIIFSVLVVVSAITTMDYLVYLCRSAPKTANLTRTVWRIGMFCTTVLVYWYMNGMKFL